MWPVAWSVRVSMSGCAQIKGHCFCREEIYGLAPTEGGASADAGGVKDAAGGVEVDGSSECVICMSEKRNTALMPCRYDVSLTHTPPTTHCPVPLLSFHGFQV